MAAARADWRGAGGRALTQQRAEQQFPRAAASVTGPGPSPEGPPSKVDRKPAKATRSPSTASASSSFHPHPLPLLPSRTLLPSSAPPRAPPPLLLPPLYLLRPYIFPFSSCQSGPPCQLTAQVATST